VLCGASCCARFCRARAHRGKLKKPGGLAIAKLGNFNEGRAYQRHLKMKWQAA
jgi:hypothetical protein